MSSPNKYQPDTNTALMMIPTCPHCDTEIASPSVFHWQAGPFLIVCIHCANCKKALAFQLLPGMLAEDGKEPSRIASPH